MTFGFNEVGPLASPSGLGQKPGLPQKQVPSMPQVPMPAAPTKPNDTSAFAAAAGAALLNDPDTRNLVIAASQHIMDDYKNQYAAWQSSAQRAAEINANLQFQERSAVINDNTQREIANQTDARSRDAIDVQKGQLDLARKADERATQAQAHEHEIQKLKLENENLEHKAKLGLVDVQKAAAEATRINAQMEYHINQVKLIGETIDSAAKLAAAGAKGKGSKGATDATGFPVKPGTFQMGGINWFDVALSDPTIKAAKTAAEANPTPANLKAYNDAQVAYEQQQFTNSNRAVLNAMGTDSTTAPGYGLPFGRALLEAVGNSAPDPSTQALFKSAISLMPDVASATNVNGASKTQLEIIMGHLERKYPDLPRLISKAYVRAALQLGYDEDAVLDAGAQLATGTASLDSLPGIGDIVTKLFVLPTAPADSTKGK